MEFIPICLFIQSNSSQEIPDCNLVTSEGFTAPKCFQSSLPFHLQMQLNAEPHFNLQPYFLFAILADKVCVVT